MNKRKRTFENLAYSFVSVLCMALLLLGVNIISRRAVYARVDLTAEKLFTLSPGTRAILAEIDQPLTLRFYFSRDLVQIPMEFKNYARRIEDLLKEYEQAGKGRINIEMLNPAPDSDAEDAAQLDGIHGQMLSAGERFYCGLAIASLDKTATLPFLSAEREHLLEYDITRAVYRIMNPEKPVIGVVSSLPVMGTEPEQRMMMMMQQQQTQPPWMLISELQRDFEVIALDPDPAEIDDSIDVLLLIYAADLSPKGLFAIDQFVLRGGRLLAFLDPHSIVDEGTSQMPAMGMPQTHSASLDELLKAWGLAFDREKVLADNVYKTSVGRGDGHSEDSPVVLSLDANAMNREDPTIGELSHILMAHGGAFSGTPAAGLTQAVLLSSSEHSQLIEVALAQTSAAQISREFKSSNTRHKLAVRLTGDFQTAFPDGAPAATEPEDGADTEKAPTDTENHLRKSSRPGAVVLIADADMLFDHFCVRRQNLFGQQMFVPLNDNLTFVQNLVEHLSGDSNLISIRSRGKSVRPFERVAAMEARATDKYQEELQTLEEDLEHVKQRLNQLQRSRNEDQRTILSAEQLAEIENFRRRETETNRKLKDLRRELRREIDSLEIRLKWLNIVLVPLLVGLGGIILSIYRHRRSNRG